MQRRKWQMSSSKLMRWSGLAALVGGVLFVIVTVAEFLVVGNRPLSEAAATSPWLVIEVGYVVTVVLIGFGLVGLYARQAQRAGTLGLIAFVVTFIGVLLATGSVWSEAFLGPWLARTAPDLLDSGAADSMFFAFWLSYILFSLGWFLFGLASLRAGGLSRGAAILLMIGAPLPIVLGFLNVPLGNVLFGAALAWAGYELWSGTGAADEPELMAHTAA
jgi:hypothetical protein